MILTLWSISMACCLDIWLLLVCITERIFVLIGSALPLPYSRSRSLYRCNKSMTSTEHQYVAISSPVLVSSCTTSSSSTATPTHHQYQYPYSSERYLPASPTDSRRVRWIQGTKYSIIVKFLSNRHQGEFRLVWRASELIWWMVLMFLVVAMWSSSEAASYRTP